MIGRVVASDMTRPAQSTTHTVDPVLSVMRATPLVELDGAEYAEQHTHQSVLEVVVRDVVLHSMSVIGFVKEAIQVANIQLSVALGKVRDLGKQKVDEDAGKRSVVHDIEAQRRRRRSGVEDCTACWAPVLVLEPVLDAGLAEIVLAGWRIDANHGMVFIEGLEADTASVESDDVALQKLLVSW